MGKTVRLTESDLNRIVRRTISEMDFSLEKEESSGGADMVQSYMQSIADMSPEKQLEEVDEMMFQLKMYKTNLLSLGKGHPNAR
jgi:hypothetical protein